MQGNHILLEQRFISILLEHKDLVSEWVNGNLDIIHFDKNHKLILSAISDSHQKNSLLTRDTYYHFAKSLISNPPELSAQTLLYDRISILNEDRNNYDVLLKQILESYITKYSFEYIKTFRDNLSSRGATFALERLAKQTSDLSIDSTVEQEKTTYVSVKEYAPLYLDALKKRIEAGEEDSITCGIKEIDETMVVGFAPGTLTLFCSDVGGFKSTMMLNLGMNIWEKGHRVLFVPLEMPGDKMFQKFLSRYSKIDFGKLEHPKLLTDNEREHLDKKIKELESPDGSNFYMMDTMERVPVSVIRREIEKNIDIFKPDVVIVDYIANLVPEKDSQVSSSRNDLQIGEMLKSLRVMGRPGSIHEKGFGVISGAQIGREALKRVRRMGTSKTSFNSEDLRGSQEYSADATNIYAQMPEEGQESCRLSLYVVKARYGKKIFPGNVTRASLEVQPEISLIKSIEDSWLADSTDEILKKANDNSVSVDDINESLTFDGVPDDAQEEHFNTAEEILGENDDEQKISVDDIDLDGDI